MISPETLRRYTHFADISEASLKTLAMVADEKTFPAGTTIFRDGDPATHLNVIVKGEVDIQYELGNGERRTVDTLVAGDLLCWSALVAPYKTTAIGTATKDTQVVQLEAAKVRELCEKDPTLGFPLMTRVAKLLADRLDTARVQLATGD
ncbi:MAG: cyclic nucleotide-binding domain-containing protein [Sedimentisphaerales bacterium]|nr:cyclic nucleotide-binding domain-containing protein [Sedimentisphaerales bacterium]